MYVPHFNALDDEAEIRALVAAVGTADLVTVGADGFPVATLLPVLWEDGTLVMHLARANPQWRAVANGAPALAVVTGPDAYVSPAWYPSKDEHGRVVPTWNYSQVHLTGRLSVHHDPAWLLDAVTRLTNRHEEHRTDRWSVDDAPAPYVEKQLKAIVGLELAVERVEAKVKLSQNRSEADRAGVVAGLRAEGGTAGAAVARQMADDG